MLHVHRSERADALLTALADLLATPLSDPFATEIVAVHTRGMERWLAQRLSARLGTSARGGDGVCANVDFPTPARLIADAVAQATGIDPDEDPWRVERAVWPLLELVDAAAGEAWLPSIGASTPAPDEQPRRLHGVLHIAELFDRYALLRPEMIQAWAGGGGEGLPADAAWQLRLWRLLRARIGLPSPAERLPDGCALLRARPHAIALPARLCLFGITRLPTAHVEVLAALAAGREVHLFALHPSPALWDAIAGELVSAPLPASRGADTTADLARNRLLASWGRDARELQLVLVRAGAQADHHDALPARGVPEPTLLMRLQKAVRLNLPAPDRRPPLAGDDESVQIHSCHGRARQVEVLHDAILHLLAGDLTLEPRDIVVMCPDVETFAPLIAAVFGTSHGHDDGDGDEDGAATGPRPAQLRVRLADRSLRQTNPVLGVVAALLELADQRMSASQVLDLADREPVRRRFSLDDDDLDRVRDWISQGAIRWGLDAEHRRPFKLSALDSGTFRAGLRRLMLGVAMTEDGQRRFAGVLPLDDVESGAIDLAGRFGELIARLGAAADAFSQPLPIDGWAAAIAAAADALARPDDREAWQRAQLQRILDELVAEAGDGGSELSLPEVRGLLAGRLAGRATRTGFRTGHLTVCTLMPMRSVPHRVVCLLGLDDGVFPRAGARDEDDLTLRNPRVGERDARGEDRQLLLDALLAASERLLVTYTGNDERTNVARPPAVPLGELLDAIDATVSCGDGPARSRVLVRHPLQPFDPRNFEPGALIARRPWSFDAVALRGARALEGPRGDAPPFLARPLPVPAAAVVELDDLVRFVMHPVRAFLRQRLGVDLRDFSEEVEDGLSVELDPLGRYAVGERLLRAWLGGVAERTAGLAEIARGTLPPGELGLPVLREAMRTVARIVAQAQTLAGDLTEPASVDVRVSLPDGRTLAGTVGGLHGDLLLATAFARVSPRHRLAAWVRLLALTTDDPARAFRAATVGRGRGDGVAVVRAGPLAPDAAARRREAMSQLAVVVDLYDRGMREPLPLYSHTSAAYAAAARAGADARAAARREWASDHERDREDREREHVRVLGRVLELDELLEQRALASETGEGWDTTEESRLGRLARRLWDGLLDREQITDA